MKGRDQGKVPPAADMVVCFPSRGHLSLLPKPICSPVRPPELGRHRRRNSHHMRSSSIRAAPAAAAAASGGGGYAGSPNLWPKDKNLDISEPSSPKVTCVGQIKVRPRRSSCPNWRSVMEEFERIQSNGKQRRSTWSEALRFVTCLRSLRLDFRCFGGVQEAEVTSEEDEGDDDGGGSDQITAESRKVYSSNWYMIVKEEKEDDEADGYNFHKSSETPETEDMPVAAPPPNALLLMRCRSAPAKTWQEEEEEEEEGTKHKEMPKKGGESKKGVVIMRCEESFSKLSADVVEETWLVGGIRDIMIPRSRSCRR